MRQKINCFGAVLSLLALATGLDPRRKAPPYIPRNGKAERELLTTPEGRSDKQAAQAKRDMRKAKRVAILQRNRAGSINDRVDL